jgi:hypothetical protein
VRGCTNAVAALKEKFGRLAARSDAQQRETADLHRTKSRTALMTEHVAVAGTSSTQQVTPSLGYFPGPAA